MERAAMIRRRCSSIIFVLCIALAVVSLMRGFMIPLESPSFTSSESFLPPETSKRPLQASPRSGNDERTVLNTSLEDGVVRQLHSSIDGTELKATEDARDVEMEPNQSESDESSSEENAVQDKMETSSPDNKQIRRLWNETRPPSLYICGYASSKNIPGYRQLFPRHEYLDATTEEQKERIRSPDLSQVYSTEDILLDYGMSYSPGCAGAWDHDEHYRDWIEKFPGKVVMVNGESVGSWYGPKPVFELGYYADSERTLRFRFLQTVLLSYGPTLWEKIFNHALKSKSIKERFMLYAVSNCVFFRDEAVDQMAQIDIVDKAGQCWGNQRDSTRFRDAPEELRDPDWFKNAQSFGNRYRFCLAMENANVPGYITEKILNAFLGGCIPIYYGSREVFDIFNKEAFIYYDIENPTEAIERVRYLEENSSAFDYVMDQPILANGSDTIENYFSFTDQIGNATLLKRFHKMLGLL